MTSKRITLILLLLLVVCITFNTLHAYDPPAFLTSPTPEGTTPTVTTPTAQVFATIANTPFVETALPATVTTLPASGLHADIRLRLVVATVAVLFLGVSGAGLWYLLRSRKINQRK